MSWNFRSKILCSSLLATDRALKGCVGIQAERGHLSLLPFCEERPTLPQSTSALQQLVFLNGTHLLKTKYILSPVYQEWIDTVPILSSFLATL